MKTLFKLVPSPDQDYLAVLSLEGEVFFIETEKNKLADRIDFNSSLELPGGMKIRQESSVLSLGFCFDYVEQKKKKKTFNHRKFKKNSTLMSINNGTFCEYLFVDKSKTYERSLDSPWEQLLVLQNYR